MKNLSYKLVLTIFILLLAGLALSGCQTATTEAPVAEEAELVEPEPTEVPPPTPTSLPPTATVEPSSTPIPPTDTPEPTPTQNEIPRARVDPAMTYDSESDMMIVFGGFSSANCAASSAVIDDATWCLDLNKKRWINMHTESGPAAVSGGYMAYDTESDRAILFGGYDQNVKGVGDTWAYDFNTNAWTEMAEGPSPRSGARIVYDIESDRIILFGGISSKECADFGDRENNLNDTWAYDYNTDTWIDMQPTESPPARNWHFMAYDVESDRVILFGGIIKGDRGEERYVVWAYDYNSNTWEKLGSQTIAAAIQFGDMAYDSQADRIVAHGMGETWIYNYNADAWKKAYISSGSTVPPEHLNSFAIVYNSSMGRMVLFAGCSDSRLCSPLFNDVWLYDLSSSTWEKMEVSP